MAVDAARAKSLFLNASDLSDPAERAAYLDRECGGDAELRGRVEALLRANDAAPLPPAPEMGATVDSEHGAACPQNTGEYTPQPENAPPHPSGTPDYHPQVEPGLVIAGRYTLVQKIGEGGMGEVWVAKQTEPVKRKVALKLIKTGMDSKAVVARFEQERQALALMDHPNIARVLDGGMTPTGQPFFVMELVNGLPLNKFCDEMKLTPRERLELFVPICQAVQHAHQKGIVHRDLKPANILVTLIDAKPVPKVIDFGVAKATAGKLTDESMSTQFGAIVGTLEYMSPEQAGFSGEDIDTRADIYSLGVILYELLTGLRPLDAKRLKKAALMEMIRIIREEEPSKPSTRLSTDESLPSLAALRQMEPKKLMALLRGELDWVVMKCLEKQRERRYETANALSRDIQRYLADEVVEARPPSAGYRVMKFVRRNKGQVIAVSLVLIALLGGIAGTTLGLLEARQQTEKARAETDEKEEAVRAEARRVIERDDALKREFDRGQERDKANKELEYRLGVSDVLLARVAYDDRDMPLAVELLDKVPEKQRGWEWRYRKQQTRGGLFTIYGHTGMVTSVAYSPDGTRIVSGATRSGQPGEVKVWDARTGALLLDLKGLPKLSQVCVAFSPDGKRIVTGGGGAVQVWDAGTGKAMLELKGLEGNAASVAFSPDGTRIVTGGGTGDDQLGAVQLWDAGTGTALSQLEEHTRAVTNASFSPDGTRILTSSHDGTVRVWDVKTGKTLVELKGVVSSTGSVSFSPDGTRIVTCATSGKESDRRGKATVWDARTGTVLLELKGRPRAVQDTQFAQGAVGLGASFSPDGTRILTVGGDSVGIQATVRDARTGAELLELIGQEDNVASASFSPDGMQIVTGSSDGRVKVWDAGTGTARVELKGHTTWMNSVAFSPDGTRIVAGGYGEAKVWDAWTGTPLFDLKGHKGDLGCVAFSPDGARIVTGGGDGRAGEVKVWDTRTGAMLLELKGVRKRVAAVAYSPDGSRILTGGGGPPGDGGPPVGNQPGDSPATGAKVWDAQTGTLQFELEGASTWVASASFSSDGTRILTSGGMFSGDGHPMIWDARTGKLQKELKVNIQTMPTVAFNKAGTLIAGGCDRGRVRVWDAETGAELFDLKAHMGEVKTVVFSPDGQRIVSGGLDKTVKVWDAHTGTALLELKGFKGGVTSLSFNADGTRLVIGTRGEDLKPGERAKPGEVLVLDARLPSPVPELKGYKDWTQCLSFSPDGTRLATAGLPTVKVWDARTRTALGELKGHKEWANCLSFSPDGTRIITADADGLSGVVKAWDVKSGTVVLELKQFQGRLTSVAYSLDGARIVTVSQTGAVQVWDAKTGEEVQSEPIPSTVSTERISPDGRIFARGSGTRVELIPLEPDAEELAYRRLYTQPSLWRYRESYFAARAAKDDFAAAFYLKLLPPAEQTALQAKADMDAVTPLYNPATRYLFTGRPDLAIPLLVEITSIKRAKLNPNDPNLLLSSIFWLGVAYSQTGQFDKSVPLFEELLKVREAKHGRDSVATLIVVANLGVSYLHTDRLKEALPLLEEAYRGAKKDPLNLAWLGMPLLDAYAKAGENDKVATLLKEWQALPKDDPTLAQQLASYGQSLLQAKAFAEGEAVFRECLAIREKTQPNTWTPFDTKSLLGAALLGQKKYADAEPLLLAGYEGMKQRADTIPAEVRTLRLTEGLERLVQLYEATAKPNEVKKWQAEQAKYPNIAPPPPEKK